MVVDKRCMMRYFNNQRIITLITLKHDEKQQRSEQKSEYLFTEN